MNDFPFDVGNPQGCTLLLKRCKSKFDSMHYVLVASNDEEDVGFLDHAFQGQPGRIPVTSVTGGEHLLEFISGRAFHDFPFLIIIDQYLPDIDSLTLLVRLKSQQHSRLIPVAIMSGFASEENIREYYLAGANCFCKKPLDRPDWGHMADCLITLFYNRL